MKRKRGISAIIATVLILLFTIGAITVLWAAILPMVNKNLSGKTECFNIQGTLSVDKDTAYTYYDSTTDILYLKIQRSANSPEIYAMKFTIDSVGTTFYESGNIPLDDLTENGAHIYTFPDPGNDGATVLTAPVTTKIAPLVLLEDGEEKVCPANPSIEIEVR